MKKIKDYTNLKFGRLTVLQFIQRKERKSYWKCICDCGKEVVLPITYLTTGDTKSCGCLRKEKTSNLSRKNSFVKSKRLNSIWANMKRRCYNSKSTSYQYYGKKGIKVCDEWKNNFRVFQDWAYENGYDEKLTIERIDNNKGYSPDNCRWASSFEQHNNMSTNRSITYNGVIYHSTSEFCRKYNLNYNKFRQMYNRYNKDLDYAISRCVK